MKRLTTSVGLVLLLASGGAFGFFVPITTDTADTLQVTNTVSVSYTNEGHVGTARTAAKTNDVDAVYGLQARTNTALTYTNRQISPGGSEVFAFRVYNAGNTNAYLSATNLYARYGGAPSNWATNKLWIDNNGNAVVDAGDRWLPNNGTNAVLLTEDASLYFVHRITAASAATDARTITNFFKVTNRAGLTTFSTYTGVLPYATATNTNHRYGGPQWFGRQFSCIVGGPDLYVAKTVAVSNSRSYTNIAGGTAALSKIVPGTKVIYTITVTNRGSGRATDLIVSDLIPSNTVYVSNSMAWGDLASTYLTATYLEEGVNDDPDVALGIPEGYCDGTSVRFTFYNGGGTAMPPKGNAEARRKLYFQVIVK